MTSIPVPQLLAYGRARKEFTVHPIRRAEIPVEYFISLLMPTRRWTAPGYAGFAAPARRAPGRPLTLHAPDRWWALSAVHGSLLAYGLVAAVPFAAGFGPDPVTLPAATRSVAGIEEDLQVIDEMMEQAGPAFFAGETAAATLRGDLFEAIRGHVTDEVLPWYQALAPDFFGWLQA
jgi:hypothetical protein